MIDWKRWLPGIPDDEEEDAVSKTLRTLQQGASDIGTGISSAASSAGEALGTAWQSATAPAPDFTPRPEYQPQTPPTDIQPGPTGLEIAQNVGSTLAEGARAGAAAADPYLTGPARTPPSWEDPLAPVREVAEHVTQHPLSTVPFFQYGDVQQAATDPIGRRLVESAGGSGTEPAFRATIPESVPFVGGKEIAPTPQDIGGAVGSAVLDPLNLFGAGAAAAAGKGGRTIAAEAIRGLPGIGESEALIKGGAGLARRGASALGEALGRNAENVAAADARMAAEGGTALPATFGALPEPGGAGRQTVEVLQERLQTATASWQRAREAGDERMAALAREHAVDLESQLVDAQNARRSLEPAITSDVGRRVESLPLAEETADTLSGAGSRLGAADDLGGPMSVVPDMAGRMNATSGALPATRGAGALSAVNRALGEGLAGGVGGAVIEQGRNPDEDPRTAAARGFAAGAVGFPAATRLARGAARLAGAGGASEAGGALATIGTPGAGNAPQPGPGFFARFPGAQKAIAASQARAANMAARGITKPSGWDWLKQFGYSGIFAPATATGQLISGAADLALSQPKEAIRAAVTGKGGRYSAQARAQLQAVPEAWQGVLSILGGQGGSAGAAARSGGAQGTANLSERVVNPLGHLAARALEYPGEVLAEAPDAVFRPLFNAQGMQREADTIAHEMGHTGQRAAQTAERLMADAQASRASSGQQAASATAARIVDAGKAYADEMGYKGDPGGIADWIGKQAKRDDAIGLAASFLFPFSRTPGNIALATARSTPGIGLLPSVRQGRPLTSFDTVYDQAFGTLAASGFAYYASQGGITGSGPADKAERDAMVAKGWQPRSFYVPVPGLGGYYVPNRALGKWGAILDAIGEAHDVMAYTKPGGTGADYLTDAVKRISKIATDQVGLSGLADLADLADGVGSQLPGTVGRSVTRYVPFGGIIRSAALAADPTARKPEGWKALEQAQTPPEQRGFLSGLSSLRGAVGEQVAQNVPGLRGGVPEAQDLLGRPMPNAQQGLGVLIPKTTSVRDDPIIQAFQSAGVDIGSPPDSITMGKVPSVPLTPAEQRRWNEARGAYLIETTPSYTANPDFAALPPAQQAPYLEKLKTKAAERAAQVVQSEMDPEERSRRVTEAARKKAS